MAIATTELVDALRATAVRLDAGATYQWAHTGACAGVREEHRGRARALETASAPSAEDEARRAA